MTILQPDTFSTEDGDIPCYLAMWIIKYKDGKRVSNKPENQKQTLTNQTYPVFSAG